MRRRWGLRSLETDHRFSYVQDDVGGVESTAALDKTSVVFHLAARTGVRGTDELAYKRVSVDRTEHLLRACGDAGVGRFVYASSSSVYGAVANGCQREDSTLIPANAYGRSKLRAEQLCRASSMRTVALRFFTVYGPRQRPEMGFARFITAALTGDVAPLYSTGSVARDFTYVQDAVNGCVLAAAYGVPNYAYNIAGGRSVRLAEAISLIEAELGLPVPLAPSPSAVAEAERTRADLSLASKHLGYSPRVSIREGLRAQIAAADRTRSSVSLL